MRQTILILTIFSLLSCSHHNEITKISMGVSGAWQHGGYTISIDSSGKFNYWGRVGDRGWVRDYCTGKFSHSQWDTLIRKLDSIDFKKVDSTALLGSADVCYYELIIHFKNDKKRLIRAGANNSDQVSKVLNWLDKGCSQMKLVKSKSPMKFETTFQSNVPDDDPNRYKIKE